MKGDAVDAFLLTGDDGLGSVELRLRSVSRCSRWSKGGIYQMKAELKGPKSNDEQNITQVGSSVMNQRSV